MLTNWWNNPRGVETDCSHCSKQKTPPAHTNSSERSSHTWNMKLRSLVDPLDCMQAPLIHHSGTQSSDLTETFLTHAGETSADLMCKQIWSHTTNQDLCSATSGYYTNTLIHKPTLCRQATLTISIYQSGGYGSSAQWDIIVARVQTHQFHSSISTWKLLPWHSFTVNVPTLGEAIHHAEVV